MAVKLNNKHEPQQKLWTMGLALLCKRIYSCFGDLHVLSGATFTLKLWPFQRRRLIKMRRFCWEANLTNWGGGWEMTLCCLQAKKHLWWKSKVRFSFCLSFLTFHPYLFLTQPPFFLSAHLSVSLTLTWYLTPQIVQRQYHGWLHLLCLSTEQTVMCPLSAPLWKHTCVTAAHAHEHSDVHGYVKSISNAQMPSGKLHSRSACHTHTHKQMRHLYGQPNGLPSAASPPVKLP